MFKSGAKELEFELKALILRFKEARLALGDKNSRDKRMWLTGVWRGLFE